MMKKMAIAAVLSLIVAVLFSMGRYEWCVSVMVVICVSSLILEELMRKRRLKREIPKPSWEK